MKRMLFPTLGAILLIATVAQVSAMRSTRPVAAPATAPAAAQQIVAEGRLVAYPDAEVTVVSVPGRRFTNRPEDNPNAWISEQEGDYGFFTPYSWWPLWLGLTGAICFLGLAVGWWLFIIGAFFGIVSVIGWTFEHYRGQYAN